MKLVVVLNEAGHLAHARAAPGGPEVEHDDFAFVIGGEINRFAVGILRRESSDVLADGMIRRRKDLIHLLIGLDYLERAISADVGHLPGCALDIEWLA